MRFAQRRLGSDEAAWDVVSETFLAAWRHWQRRPAASEEARAWLYGIARRDDAAPGLRRRSVRAGRRGRTRSRARSSRPRRGDRTGRCARSTG
ncbi:sigma factor [Pseudofrankia sp. DC12]|uniref:RNA polymerase sigma factor n=1 Tax=Pseudofrankia sp. DC12 TaxID=683315 RepID=UPI001E64557F|nr:sigma factor [Pseudofrankia sp. DC12]